MKSANQLHGKGFVDSQTSSIVRESKFNTLWNFTLISDGCYNCSGQNRMCTIKKTWENSHFLNIRLVVTCSLCTSYSSSQNISSVLNKSLKIFITQYSQFLNLNFFTSYNIMTFHSFLKSIPSLKVRSTLKKSI